MMSTKNKTLKKKSRPMQENQIPKTIFFCENQNLIPGFYGKLCRNNFNLHSRNLLSKKQLCVCSTYQCEAQNEKLQKRKIVTVQEINYCIEKQNKILRFKFSVIVIFSDER